MGTDRYTVTVIFRGLCLAHPNPEGGSLDVYLPDTSSIPQPSAEEAEADARARVLRTAGPFREHQAVLEFFRADWDNQSSSMPRLLRVDKPNKQPAALYLLKRQRIHLQGLHGGADQLQPPTAEQLKVDEERYANLGNSLFLLEEDDELGFDQLPGFRSALAEDAEDHCAAMTSLSCGEAVTERRSRQGGVDLAWREVLALDNGTEVGPARAVNLDVVVRFTLPVWNPLLVTCTPVDPGVAGDERSFILRPSDPSRGLTLWVKNRELSQILLDSDLDPDPYPADCPHQGDLDHDIALLVLLAEQPEVVTVPQRATGDASDCGSGCGCSGGPGKPPGE